MERIIEITVMGNIGIIGCQALNPRRGLRPTSRSSSKHKVPKPQGRCPHIIENQMEKKMYNEVDTGGR